MWRVAVVAGSVCALAGCGEYFDRHPANVRPESEAVAAVLAVRPAHTSSMAVAPAVPIQAETKRGAPISAPLPASAAPPPVAVARIVPEKALRPPTALTSPHRTTSIEPKPYPTTVTATNFSAAPVETHVVVSVPSAPPSAAAASVSPVRGPRSTTPAQKQLSVPEIVEVTPAAPIAAEEKPTTSSATVSRNMAAPPAPIPAPVQRPPVTEPQYEPAPPPPAVAMQPVPAAPPTADGPPAPPVSNAHCEAVAKQRAEDAAASGLDPETQETVRSGTYANCLAWDVAHPGRK